jgi:NTP pyrophosphatase (non-canonical NTP hydrolase)
MLGPNSSLKCFQERNDALYRIPNDRYYSAEKIFMRLHRHITHILKAVRKNRYMHIEYNLCMAFSWALAMFNRYHIDLATEMWRRFPGRCPYCWTAPCGCKERRRKRRKFSGRPNVAVPVSIRAWQKMFAKIYPNVVLESAIHLAEEAGEVNEALQVYMVECDDASFRRVIEELVDVVTHIFGVANCMKLDLAHWISGYFSGGCPRCRKAPCDCGFIMEDSAAL